MKLSWQFWFLAPMVVALATVVLFPTVYLFWMSVQHWLVTDPQRYFVGADNFARLLRGSDFWQAMQVTSVYLLLSTALMMVLAMGLALAFAQAGSGWMRAICSATAR